MCKTKMAISASEPDPAASRPPSRLSRSQRSHPTHSPRNSRSTASASASSSSSSYQDSNVISSSSSSSTNRFSSGTVSGSSRTSLSSLRESLPETPQIYDFSEICSVTNNFLAKRYSLTSSTPSWRCKLRGKGVIIFQRKFRRKFEIQELRDRLYKICRSHHTSIVKLLGISVSGEHVYLVYEFVNGVNLAVCLKNPRNPNFTVLSNWISRMNVATDLAHGLDYIHNKTGLNMTLTHNHIKSSSIIVTEPSFNAKICHFGAAQFCGEDDQNEGTEIQKASHSNYEGEITVDSGVMMQESRPEKLERSGSRKVQVEGVRGYMAPEYQSTGMATQMTDVYAFGVVLLELLTGEEPLKFEFDKSKGDFVRMSLIETAKAVIDGDGGGDDGGSRADEFSDANTLGVEARVRRWVDRRLKDSFPVKVAEKVTRLAVQCVHVDPAKRPNMARVAGKISKLYLESKIWSDSVTIQSSVSVSLAPR